MFCILVRYHVPLEQILPLVPAHRAWLDVHYAAGVFLLSGPQDPRTGGVILAHTMDRAALEALLQDDPFCQHGLTSYEVTAFHPNKAAPDLACLLNG